MRNSKIAGLVFALALGAASSGLAQQPAHRHQDGEAKQGSHGRMQHGGFGMLLKGIELTAEQKTQLQALRAKHGDKGHGMQQGEGHEQMKAARERGDTAAMRQFHTQRRAEMKQRHETMVTEVRAILTPAQREVFDRNVADAKTRAEKHGKRGVQRRS